jgi:DNA-binding IclR family transcriptional regulator
MVRQRQISTAADDGRVSGDATGVRPVQSVQRALGILKCFSVDSPELGITEIAESLGLHKSTVHRLMITLMGEGFVHVVEGGRYALGWRMYELGAAVSVWGEIRNVVVETLQSLVDQTGESAHLAVLDGLDVLYIEKVEPSRPLRMPSARGKRVPPYCSALGKVLLAGLDEKALLAYLYASTFTPYTGKTITDPDMLRNEIARIRVDGFAVDREELEEGLMCIGAPVVDGNGLVCAAVSISGPISRLSSGLDEHKRRVVKAGLELSATLGNGAHLLRDACSTPPWR